MKNRDPLDGVIASNCIVGKPLGQLAQRGKDPSIYVD